MLFCSLLLLEWLYLHLLWKQRSADQPSKLLWRQALFFSTGLILAFLLAISPIDYIGKKYLFFVYMLENMAFVYILPCLILNGLPERFFSTAYQYSSIQKIMDFFSHLVPTTLLFNLCFFGLNTPWFCEHYFHSFILHESMPILLLALGSLMWLPLIHPFKSLRLSFSEQMLYIMTLILGQVPLFAVLTFADQGIFPSYLQAPRLTPLTAYGDQQLGGWLFKLVSMLVFAAAFISILVRWHQQQRRDDRSENAVAFENFELAQRATRREG